MAERPRPSEGINFLRHPVITSRSIFNMHRIASTEEKLQQASRRSLSSHVPSEVRTRATIDVETLQSKLSRQLQKQREIVGKLQKKR